MTHRQTNRHYSFGYRLLTCFVNMNYLVLTSCRESVTLNDRLHTGKEFDTRGGLFHYDFGARHYDPALCQFPETDPFAEYYYPLSQYLYCAANPILYIDPSGLNIYYINVKTGEITCDEDNEENIIRLVDENGDIIVSLKAFYLPDGSIGAGNMHFPEYSPHPEHEGNTFDIFSIGGSGKGRALFEFLSSNVTRTSGIEYTYVRTPTRDFILSSRTPGEEAGFSSYFYSDLYNKRILEVSHSHQVTPEPSGADKKAKKGFQLHVRDRKGTKRYTHYNTTFYVFYVGDNPFVVPIYIKY